MIVHAIVRRLSFNRTHRSGGIANNGTPRCGEVSRIPSPKVNKLQNRLSIADERGHTEAAVLERLFSDSCKSYENSNEIDDVERGRSLARVAHERV